jgi:hypothetical protein
MQAISEFMKYIDNIDAMVFYPRAFVLLAFGYLLFLIAIQIIFRTKSAKRKLAATDADLEDKVVSCIINELTANPKDFKPRASEYIINIKTGFVVYIDNTKVFIVAPVSYVLSTKQQQRLLHGINTWKTNYIVNTLAYKEDYDGEVSIKSKPASAYN